MILDLETREDVKIDILGVVLTQVERTAAVNLVRQMFEKIRNTPLFSSKPASARGGSAVPESTIAAVPVVLYSKNPILPWTTCSFGTRSNGVWQKKEADE